MEVCSEVIGNGDVGRIRVSRAAVSGPGRPEDGIS